MIREETSVTASRHSTAFFDRITIEGGGLPERRARVWRRLLRACGLLAFLVPVAAPAVSGVWINAGGGSWTNAANWSGGILATNTDALADFSTLNLPANATVTLDGARTLGGLVFADTSPNRNWTLNTGSAGPLTLAVSSGTPVINVINQTATLGVVLAGAQGLAKAGAGRLALNTANTYHGDTLIPEGTVTFGDTGAFGSTGAITIGGGTGNAALLGNVAGYLSRNITVNSQTGGTVTLGALSTFNPGSTLRGFSGTVTLHGDVTLQSSPDSIGNRTDFSGKFSGTGNVTINDPTASSYKVIIGSNNNNSSLSNSWNGTLTINAGAMLQIGAGTPVGDGIPDTTSVTVHGQFNIAKNGNETIDALNGSSTGVITANASSDALTIGSANGSGSFAGILTGGIAITKMGTGTQTLSGVNTHTGSTRVSNGTLTIGAGGSIAASTPIVVAPGALLDVSANPGFTLNAAQTLQAGRTTGFATDIVGPFTNSGVLSVAGTGTAGTLTLSSNLWLHNGTVSLDLALANTIGAGVNDLIAVKGNLTLSGLNTLNLSPLVGTLHTNQAYTLLTCNGTLTGSVTNLTVTGYNFAANSQSHTLAVTSGAVTITVVASSTPSPPVVLDYTVAPSPWTIDQRGNRRVVVNVTQAVDAVRVEIPWRRRDNNPQNKNIVVVDAATGAVIANRTAISITRESGTMVFQPQTVPGDYHVYFMPFTDDPNYNGWYGGNYVSMQTTASGAWLAANNLPSGASALPEATPLRIEARLPDDNFWPMEVPLTAAEKAAFLAAHPGGYLVVPEDRQHPIKMRDELPYRWLAGALTNRFSGTAMRDEYFAFQLGIYAVTQSVQNVQLAFTDLTSGGATIPASAINCINLGGTNWDGTMFSKTVNVAQGAIQPLWVGVMISADAAAGLYSGTVTVSADNAPSQIVNLALTVTNALAVRHGDDAPTNHTRLRWLDSQVAVDDTVIPPYTPVTLSNQTVGVLGRSLTFTNLGFPASIKAGTNEILQSPVQFGVEVGGSPVNFAGGTPTVTATNQGRVSWQATATSGALTMLTTATMEFDGHVKYLVTVSASSAATLSNVKLQIPLTAAASSLMVGINYEGGVRPSGYNWAWTSPHDSVWLGGVKAGLHTEFRGGSYHGPLLNLYQPADPPTWGGGSVLVTNFGSGALLQANTGSRSLAAGASVTYEFAMLITPVKPLDTALHFGDRYFHDPLAPTPLSDYQDWDVNVINVHHANFVNPFINWPFAVLPDTINFITNYQAQGVKVKMYYTVREVTQKMAEIWAVRSLGNEVLASGGGGGFPWLREHFISDYSVAWYVPSGSDYDAAVTTTRDSRFYNYYVEGVRWLAQNANIDGLYLDDVAFDRQTLKRVRRILKHESPGSRIDLHSNTGFSIGPANQYAEFMPYVDRIWFGESFNYNAMTPEEWLARVSGIPFGLMGELLQGGGNKWLGAVFGMTPRWGWTTAGVYMDPRAVWRIWDQFGGLTNATMVGWWDDNPFVTASDSEVKATAFVKSGKTLLAVGNFSSLQKSVTLDVNWTALGLDSNSCSLFAPASSGFQAQATYLPGDTITIPAKQGLMLIVEPGQTNLVSTNELKAHYRMSESNGTAAMDDTGRYHGQYLGEPVIGGTDVPAGAEASLRSVLFSGAQWMELPAALADDTFRPGGSWTISFWVRPTLPSSAYNATFVWLDDPEVVRGILFYLEGNGSLDFWLGDGATWNNWPNYNPGTMLQDRWHHIAATYDGATLRGYLDGALVKTVAINSFLFPAAGRPITVGLRVGASPAADLHGRMTDLRLYTGVLNTQDIVALNTYPGRHVPAEATGPAYATLSSAQVGAHLLLSIPAVASWQYQLERATNLVPGSWTAVGVPIAAPPAGNRITFTSSVSSELQEFFRLSIIP